MLLGLLAAGPGQHLSVGLKQNYVPKVFQFVTLAIISSFSLKLIPMGNKRPQLMELRPYIWNMKKPSN